MAAPLKARSATSKRSVTAPQAESLLPNPQGELEPPQILATASSGTVEISASVTRWSLIDRGKPIAASRRNLEILNKKKMLLSNPFSGR
jgi:hypothetical protein